MSLELALELANVADEITIARFGAQDLVVEEKPDHSPVTDADRATEDALRSFIEKHAPGDGVFGEERGGNVSGRRWIIDPIDGTKNFMRGVPVWATLIALMEDDEVVTGVVSAPALGRRWWASKGAGAFSGGSLAKKRQLRVSGVKELCHASFSYSSLTGWKERDQLQGILNISDTVWRTRAYGDFWSYMMVAEGTVDFAAEPELEIYDMAALVPIVTEAGGRFTSVEGKEGPVGPGAIASNGLLHEDVLGFFS